jgi:hypothetical protein
VLVLFGVALSDVEGAVIFASSGALATSLLMLLASRYVLIDVLLLQQSLQAVLLVNVAHDLAFLLHEGQVAWAAVVGLLLHEIFILAALLIGAKKIKEITEHSSSAWDFYGDDDEL